MTDNRLSEKEKKVQREEPDYVRTVRDDGRKYIDPNEFIKDDRVREQIRRLAKEANGR